jgi:peptidoglycan/LPS O-acetylase OafA/YrhL
MAHIRYRPDLDGLRGIAIAMAVLYHTGLSILPSGFVGIEIFFVLSGYLITSQLAQDILNNKYSLKTFYLKRFRRLLPAYLFIAISIMVVAYFILLPEDFIYHNRLTGLGFLSLGNFYLTNTTGGYFAKEIDLIPFVHTWSLSVEEQFYLLWPILLYFILTKLSYKKAIVFFSGVFVIALAYSEWLVNHDEIAAYFLMPSRFYELLLGSLLALTWQFLPTLKSWQATMLALLGLLIITINAFSETANLHFPGFNAIYTCLATAMIIYAGGYSNRVSDAISIGPLTGLGKISYSLYLWHWPIFVFIRYVTGGITPLQSFLAILLSLTLSILTWQFIENPFRLKWKFSFKKTLIAMYIIPACIFVVMNIVVEKQKGMPERFGEHMDAVIAMDSKPKIYNEYCDASNEKCRIAALIGDSHAEHFSPFMHQLIGDNKNLKLQTQSIGFCPPLEGLYRALIDEEKGKKTIYTTNNECYEKTQKFYEQLTSEKYAYVILSSYWSMIDLKPNNVFYFDVEGEEFSYEKSLLIRKAALYKSINTIIGKNITPVILKDNLSISEEKLQCARKKIFIDAFNDNCDVAYEELIAQQEKVNALFADVEKDFPQVKFIDVNDVLCRDKVVCKTTMDGTPLYRDVQHITGIGSTSIAQQYIAVFGRPLE